MPTKTQICFNVTPAQKETIDLRAKENGFDDTLSYIKVTALKAESFNLTPAGESSEEATESLCIDVTDLQKEKIEQNIKESGCETFARYLQYVALHAVVGTVLEVRSTGSFDSMVDRILARKKSQ